MTGADETARATFEEHPQARLAGDGSLPGRWAWSSHQLWAVPVPLTAPRAAPARPASQPLEPNRTLFIEIMPDATDSYDQGDHGNDSLGQSRTIKTIHAVLFSFPHIARLYVAIGTYIFQMFTPYFPQIDGPHEFSFGPTHLTTSL